MSHSCSAGSGCNFATLLAEIYRLPELPISVGQARLRPVKRGAQIVSFCRELDRLDLWRNYAENGEGVCLVMPLKTAALAVDGEPWNFYRVAYDQRSMARAWTLLFKPLTALLACAAEWPVADGADQIQDELSRLFFIFKHEQFRSEREIRLLHKGNDPLQCLMDPQRTILPTPKFFMAGKGCKIIVGPRAPDRNKRAAYLDARFRVRF